MAGPSGRVGFAVIDRARPAAGVHCDLLWLHCFGHFAHQFDHQQAVGKVGVLDADEVGQLEAALEAAGGDAQVQIGALVVLVLLAPLARHQQQVLLRGDVDLVGLEAGDGDRDPVAVLGDALEVERRIIFGSLLAGAGVWARVGFAALAMCISLWLIDQLRRGAPRWEAAGYCLILGGALGNAADRLLRGAVVDFLDFHWRGTHWPAFNLADVAITVGAVCLIVATRRRGGQIRANSTA